MDTTAAIEAAREAIAEEIRSRRARIRMNQVEFAKAVGTSRTTIARLEAGEKTTTIPDLIRISAVLDTDPAEFLRAVVDTMTKKLSA